MLSASIKAAAWNYSRAAADLAMTVSRARFIAADLTGRHYFWATMDIAATVGLAAECVFLAFQAAKPEFTHRLQHKILEMTKKPFQPICRRGLWGYTMAAFNSVVTVSRAHSLIPDIARRLYGWVAVDIAATLGLAVEAGYFLFRAAKPGATHRVERNMMKSTRARLKAISESRDLCVLKLS